jgi:hypothetical protein
LAKLPFNIFALLKQTPICFGTYLTMLYLSSESTPELNTPQGATPIFLLWELPPLHQEENKPVSEIPHPRQVNFLYPKTGLLCHA